MCTPVKNIHEKSGKSWTRSGYWFGELLGETSRMRREGSGLEGNDGCCAVWVLVQIAMVVSAKECGKEQFILGGL